MLQFISEKIQGWVTWSIAILVSASFAVWGLSNFSGGRNKDVVVASVNGDDITKRALTQQIESLKAEQRRQLNENTLASTTAESVLRQQALQQLIRAQVMAQAAKKLKLTLSDEQLVAYLKTIPGLQQNGQFSKAQLTAVLSQLGMSGNEFLSLLRSEQLINQLQFGLASSSFVLPADLKQAAQLFYQKRDIAYAIVPTARFKATINITDEAIKNYYEAHQDEFMTPEQVALNYIVLDKTKVEKSLPKPSQAQVQAYYESHLDAFTRKPSWQLVYLQVVLPENANAKAKKAYTDKLIAIEKALQEGKSLKTLARKYSDDLLTKGKGGALGWVNPGTLDPAVEKKLANLKVGDVSAPITTEFGTAFVNLTAEKPAVVTPLEKVQTRIEAALMNQVADKAFVAKAEQLAKLAFEQPDSLTETANTLDLTVQSSEKLGRQGRVSEPALNHAPVRKAAFSDDVLLGGNNSEAISIADNQLMVLRVKQRYPAALQPLSRVHTSIQLLLTDKASSVAASEFVEKVLAYNKKNHPKEVNMLAEKFNLKFETEKSVVRIKPASMPTLIQTEAFQLPRPQGKDLPAGKVILPNGDYALLVIQAVSDPAPSEVFQGQSGEMIRSELQRRLGELAFQSYVNALIATAKIDIKENAFN